MAPLTRSASRRLPQSPHSIMSADIFQSQLPSERLVTAPTPAPASDIAPSATTATDMAERNIFRFMDLPTELRLHIYRMALQRAKPLLLHLPRSKYSDDSSYSSDSAGGSGRTPEPNPRTEIEANDHIIIRYPSADIRLHPRIITRELRLTRASAVAGINTAVKGINTEPLVPEILLVSKQIYREARPVLYADNEFVLLLGSARRTLGTLHQRSRSLIKHVHLTIPSHQDVLEGFADVIRLGIRYCWGLKRLTLTLPDSFPEDQNSSLSGQLSVYANAFYILRWLPKGCEVKLLGNKIPADVKRIIDENEKLAETLDDTAYAKRQLQMPDGYRRRR